MRVPDSDARARRVILSNETNRWFDRNECPTTTGMAMTDSAIPMIAVF